MNTIEQLVEALKEAKKSIPSTYFVNGNRTEWLIDKAIAAGEAELKREPDVDCTPNNHAPANRSS